MPQFLRAFLVLASLVVCMGGPVPYAPDLGSCVNDKDCYLPNTYCYQTGKCVFCTDCSVHQRFNATGVSCAKNKDQCGGCLPGKKAESNFDQSFTCVPINSNFPITEVVSDVNSIDSTTSTTNTLDPTTQNQNSSSTGWIIYSSIGVAIFLLLAFVTFLIMQFTRRHCSTSTTAVINFLKTGGMLTSSGTGPSAPNLNSTNNNETVPEEYGRQQDYHRPVEIDRKLTANACAPPYYVRRGHLPNYNPDEPDIDRPAEEVELITPTDNLTIDEETTPSEWTPEDISPETRLTFANLNLNSSSNSQLDRSIPPTQRQDEDRNSFHNIDDEPSNDQNTRNPPSSSGAQVNIQIVNNYVANAQFRHQSVP